MADTQTTNLNLTKPEPGAAEDTWGISLNADLDTLDAIFSSSGTQVNLNPNQINFADNKKAIFGANSDLSIYSDGTTSIIEETGPGALNIQGTHLNLKNAAGNATYLAAIEGGAVTLYNSGSPKLATSSTGIDVTGVITTDGLTTSADINFGDDDKALFGAGNDLKIYHSANNQSYIHEAGTGDLNILASNFKIQNGAGTENKIVANTDGAVSLYYDNAAKLATTSTGIDVTGTVNTDSLTVTGDIEQTTGDLKYTGGINWDIAHHGASQNMIFRTTPSGGSATQRIRVSHNGDISFYDTAGTTQGFFWDASAESLGIGNTNPDGILQATHSANSENHISYEIGNSAVASTNRGGFAIYELGTKKASWVYNRDGSGQTDFSADRFRFRNSAETTEYLAIDNSGNVGIGTSSPARQFHVHDASASYLHLTNNTTGSTGSDGASISMAGTSLQISNRENGVLQIYTNGTERVRIDSSGNLLVGTTSQISAGKITVSGGTAASGITATTDATTGYSAASFQRTASVGTAVQFKQGASEVGSISVTSSATTYNTSSDARLKDITGEARGLEVINELNPVSYNWKADGKADEGLIAQEVQEIVPNAVSGSEEEHYQMDYSKLVVHLVKAVKEQQEQIESLKGEIANLKGE